MSTPGLIETLARLLGDALSPLAQRLQGNGVEEVIEQLGLRLPSGSLSSGNVTAALQASANACGQLPLSVAELVAAISGSDDVAMITAAETLAQRIIQAVTAFTQLSVALDNVVQGAGGLTPAQTTRLRAAAQAVPERLLHLAFISYLEDKQPGVKGALDLAGIFDDVPVPGDPADASLPPHHLKRIRFDRLGPLVNDPVQHLKNLYGFGRPDFDGLELFRRVKAMVDRPEAEAIIITAPGQPAALEAFIFRLAVAPGAIPGLRIRVRAAAERDVDVAVPLGGPWSATTNAQARFQSGLEFVLHPQTGLHIEPRGCRDRRSRARCESGERRRASNDLDWSGRRKSPRAATLQQPVTDAAQCLGRCALSGREVKRRHRAREGQAGHRHFTERRFYRHYSERRESGSTVRCERHLRH